MMMSGRWLPPLYGSFRMNESPSAMSLIGYAAVTDCTAGRMEVRWIGQAHAWEIVSPSVLNRPLEPSSPSLTITATALRSSVNCMAFATDSSRLRMISTVIGSTSFWRIVSLLNPGSG